LGRRAGTFFHPHESHETCHLAESFRLGELLYRTYVEQRTSSSTSTHKVIFEPCSNTGCWAPGSGGRVEPWCVASGTGDPFASRSSGRRENAAHRRHASRKHAPHRRIWSSRSLWFGTSPEAPSRGTRPLTRMRTSAAMRSCVLPPHRNQERAQRAETLWVSDLGRASFRAPFFAEGRQLRKDALAQP
jgi:hypothetical protein